MAISRRKSLSGAGVALIAALIAASRIGPLERATRRRGRQSSQAIAERLAGPVVHLVGDRLVDVDVAGPIGVSRSPAFTFDGDSFSSASLIVCSSVLPSLNFTTPDGVQSTRRSGRAAQTGVQLAHLGRRSDSLEHRLGQLAFASSCSFSRPLLEPSFDDGRQRVGSFAAAGVATGSSSLRHCRRRRRDTRDSLPSSAMFWPGPSRAFRPGWPTGQPPALRSRSRSQWSTGRRR